MSEGVFTDAPHRRNWAAIGAAVVGLTGLYAISSSHHLLFHCLAESFTVFTATAVFSIFWNTRRFHDNGAFLVLGFGGLFAGIFGFVHLLTYPQMAVFATANVNTTLQAKTLFHWCVSLSSVCAVFYLRRKINVRLGLMVYIALSAAALGAIYLRVFPDYLTEAQQFTLFGKAARAASILAYLAALLLLYRRRSEVDEQVVRLLMSALAAFLAENLASVIAASIYSPARTAAHLLQVFAVCLAYAAFVRVGLARPYEVLFRRQRQTAEALERQRQFLEAVLDTVHSGIVACDGQGMLTLFNRAARNLHGLPAERLPPDRWPERYGLFHADGKTRMTTAEIPLYRALRGEQVHQVEMMICPADAPCWTCLASGEPLTDKDGVNCGAVVALHDITDRKRAEEALRESEERYRALFNSMTEGFSLHEIVTDENGKPCDYRYLEVNPSFERLTGYKREDVIGRLKRTATPGEDDFWIQAYGAVALGGPPARFEHQGPASDRHWQVYAFRPAPRQFAVVFSDITERKRADEAKRLEEARLQALVDLHQMAGASVQEIADFAQEAAVAVTGSQLGYLAFVNPDETELVMHSWSKTVMQACAVADKPIVYQVAATGLWGEAVRQRKAIITNDYEAPNPWKRGCPEGHVRLRRHMNAPIFDGDRIVLVAGVANKRQPYDDTDVRQLTLLMQGMWRLLQNKRHAEAVRQSEERNRLLVEALPQIAWRQSADGQEMDCNRRWYEYTGQTPDETQGHGWLSAVHPDDVLWLAQSAARAADARQPYEIEFRLRRSADRMYRWHLARSAPVCGADGQVVCWIGSATDIEDMKQAQETLQRAHAEQLQRHRAELAHAARLSTMGEMAAGLAHELNQPLYAVKNYARGCVRRLQKTPQQDAELMAALGQIGEEAGRAAEIVRRVRAFVEKRKPQVAEVALNQLVEEVVLLSRAEIDQRRVQLVLELADDLPAAVGDRIQIEQTLMNLVRNGLDSLDDAPESQRRLCVRTRLRADHFIEVAVCDNGKGLAGNDPEKIFEPFFTTKPEGMGMGLAICRSIVQAHGGRLWVAADQDQGCTFHFTLPCGKKD